MSKMSHISVIEKYDEHHNEIHSMLSSILTCFSDEKVFELNQKDLKEMLNSLCSYYPFISLLYLLDESGKQISMNVPGMNFKNQPKIGRGLDRSKRPYYLLAMKSDSVAVTEPYLSSIKRELCLSTSIKVCDNSGQLLGFIVLDIDLSAILSFLTGDSKRKHFEPYFKAMYSLIVLGLFAVSLILLYAALRECMQVLHILIYQPGEIVMPFGVVIYLTLALAIFDLAKTTLEEEVLLYKDILRHSSTRRTITRFVAAIIIAVSIEALLMIFKSALHDGEHMLDAVWVMLASAMLLLALGVYIYLGSKAEVMLVKGRNKVNTGDRSG
ncbi:Cache domain protein [Methyloprofundus sedimenti]|uniref:Cache domain protein n=1 Tax=Methyloprofundus sedimenti TaxID=1420851 RepID=A0A1V8M774_9GAMM|nr:PDC sensor domain-containing protein [Methyloprofundus sedimenti]OQK17431.1 Cache domain protein [Methyloprofundus sedimenti]